LAAPVPEFAEGALSKRWKKVGKRAHGLENLDADQRHELRKELKKLRYAVEFLSPLFPRKRVDRFVKSLKKLQTVFGELNDSATVKAMFTRMEVRCAGDPGAQRAIGWVVGASQARADYGWAGAKGLWRKLKDTGLFWG
jgi:CHAD domain-containing protein